MLRWWICVINFTSFTPDNSWEINCVILEGWMVIRVFAQSNKQNTHKLFESSSCKLGAYMNSRLTSSTNKRAQRLTSLGPETAWWGGCLPRERVVAEKLVPSLESLFSLGFEGRKLGCPRNFAGMSRTPGAVQKVCAKNVRAHFRPPKFRRWPSLNAVKQGALDTPPPKFRGWICPPQI